MKYLLLAITIAVAITFIVVRVIKGGVWGLFTKTTASFAFVALGLVGAYRHGLTMVAGFILMGLIFGMLGDIVLDLKKIYKNDEKPYLNAGMLSFGLGHIMYMIATILYSNSLFRNDIRTTYLAMIGIGVGGIITIIIACFGEKLLKLNFGYYRYQTYAYTFILSFMSVFSVAVACFKPVFLIFALGIVYIFLSDLVLSKQYFGGKQDCKVLTTLNHAIYYAGQIAIAFSLFFI